VALKLYEDPIGSTSTGYLPPRCYIDVFVMGDHLRPKRVLKHVMLAGVNNVRVSRNKSQLPQRTFTVDIPVGEEKIARSRTAGKLVFIRVVGVPEH
jgi:hypothetical protein